jgi:hypothetical protein
VGTRRAQQMMAVVAAAVCACVRGRGEECGRERGGGADAVSSGESREAAGDAAARANAAKRSPSSLGSASARDEPSHTHLAQLLDTYPHAHTRCTRTHTLKHTPRPLRSTFRSSPATLARARLENLSRAETRQDNTRSRTPARPKRGRDTAEPANARGFRPPTAPTLRECARAPPRGEERDGQAQELGQAAAEKGEMGIVL